MLGTLSEEVQVKVAARKAWKLYSSLELGNVVAKHFLEKLELVEGDSGVGYDVTSYKEKFTKIDDENMVKEVEIVEGGFLDMGFSLYRVRFEIKVNPKDETGSSCIVKSTIEYDVKEEAAAANASLVTMEPLLIVMKVANEHLISSN